MGQVPSPQHHIPSLLIDVRSEAEILSHPISFQFSYEFSYHMAAKIVRITSFTFIIPEMQNMSAIC
jgi:hypothetical protein